MIGSSFANGDIMVRKDGTTGGTDGHCCIITLDSIRSVAHWPQKRARLLGAGRLQGLLPAVVALCYQQCFLANQKVGS